MRILLPDLGSSPWRKDGKICASWASSPSAGTISHWNESSIYIWAIFKVLRTRWASFVSGVSGLAALGRQLWHPSIDGRLNGPGDKVYSICSVGFRVHHWLLHEKDCNIFIYRFLFIVLRARGPDARNAQDILHPLRFLFPRPLLDDRAVIPECYKVIFIALLRLRIKNH